MKKIACLLLLLVAFQVSAQEFHFIPKIGLNFANMTNSDGSMKPGLNIGVAGEVMMTNNFAIEPGIFYSMQGAKGKDGGASLKIKNDYLNIPVLFKGYVYEGFNLFAGPQLGFKVSSKLKYSKSGTSVSTSEGSDLFIGLANTINADKFAALPGGSGMEGEKSRNGVLQFNVGWRF